MVFILAVDFQQIAAREFITLAARVFQVQSGFALRHLLNEHKDAVIHAIDQYLAIAAVGRVLHPRAREFKGQHVSHQALVVVGGKQNPLAVLAHAQQ